MQEIKQAIVLAAGASRRMGDLTKDKPKCLLPYKGEVILNRLIRQLKEHGIEKIAVTAGFAKEKVKELLKDEKGVIIVENDLWEQDVNINSMRLALNEIDKSCVIFEADTIMEDHLVQYVTGSDFEGQSVWFTRGMFNSSQYGGILNSDRAGNIIDIKVVPEYKDDYEKYTKLTGLMRIGSNELELFKKLVNEYANETIEQYYLVPWIENLKELPCIEGNAEHYIFKTFNRPNEYEEIQNIEFDQKAPEKEEIVMVETSKLKPIENFSRERLDWLTEEIKKDGMFFKPLCIEKNHNLVLDGHHRFQVALRLGLKFMPCKLFNYDEVNVWTLRKEHIADASTVIERANKGNIYPYKTVKHRFPVPIGDCNIHLEDLK